jgi:dolichol kinase
MGELRRRAVHASGSVLPLAYLLDAELGVGLLTWERLRWLLVLGTLCVAVLELLRLTGRVEWRIFDALTREYEQDNVAGYALYAVGMTVAAWAFRPEVALAAMFMLTVGDPVSGLLSSGALSKKGPVLAVMFAVCGLIALPLVAPRAALAGAFAATVADGFKPVVAGYVIDDNLTIPVGGGAAMALALALV